MAHLFPFSYRGIPSPYLITPRTEAEATTGKATLIAIGDLDILIAGIKEAAPEREDLIEKFEMLRQS